MFDKPRQGSPSGSPSPSVTIGARELIESAPDLIFCCDSEGRFQWLNSAVEAHLGQRPADLLGHSFTDLVAESDRPHAARFYLRQNRRAKELTTTTLALNSSEGREVMFTARVRRVERPDGEVLFVGCARPASAWEDQAGNGAGSKNAYAGPHAGRDGLDLSSPDEWAGGSDAVGAGVIAPNVEGARSGAGAETDLDARLAEARSEVELKTDFLTTMGEEIRTPINGILGMAQLLLESELDPDQRSFIEVIQNSSNSLLNLVNDTLEFSKLEQDSLDVKAIDFDLRHTVEEIGTLLAPIANEKGLGFDCRVHHEVPSLLRGDPARIRQVLTNVGTAAVKLTETGKVTIACERAHEDDERVLLRFSLTDTGLGLEDNEMAKVFDAWSRADDDTARRQGGTGLALAIARKIVVNMGGEVGVSTDRDHGSCFWFRVPLEKQSTGAPADLPQADVQLRGLRVLVVDPGRASRDESMGMFMAWGCRPEAVPNHSEALSLLRRAVQDGDPFKMALIEMQLPDIDGEGLGRIIRGDASLHGTHLMLMTGIGSRGDADRVRDVGFGAYLVRPITWSALYDAVVDVLHSGTDMPDAPPARLVTRHSVAEARRGRVRILLVEDNAVNQLVAESVLKRLGFTVDKASNGAEALQKIETGTYDMVLMDLQMPQVDGYQATAALRARERGHQHTPIVAMTATATSEERRRCLESGMDEYLTKPLDLGQLTSVVEKFTMKETPRALEAADVESLRVPETADAGTDEAVEAAMAQMDGAGEGDTGEAGDSEAGQLVLTDSSGKESPRPALDTRRLEESCMGIPALRETLMSAFLTDVRPRLEKLREAVQVRDPKRVEFEAHGLKGMSATIGAACCADVFAEMETNGRDGSLDDTPGLLSRAETEVERVEEFIRRFDDMLRRAA